MCVWNLRINILSVRVGFKPLVQPEILGGRLPNGLAENLVLVRDSFLHRQLGKIL